MSTFRVWDENGKRIKGVSICQLAPLMRRATSHWSASTGKNSNNATGRSSSSTQTEQGDRMPAPFTPHSSEYLLSPATLK